MDREKIEKLITEISTLSEQTIEVSIGFFNRDFDKLDEILTKCKVLEKNLEDDRRYGYVSKQISWIRDAVGSAKRKNAEREVACELSSAVSRLRNAWNGTKSWNEGGGLHFDEDVPE